MSNVDQFRKAAEAKRARKARNAQTARDNLAKGRAKKKD